MMERVINFLGLGRATLVNDERDVQTIQVTERAIGGPADAVSDGVQRLTEYGFTSVPPLGSDVLVIHRNGSRAAALVIATSHKQSRPRGLKAGDVAIYDQRGRSVRLTEDGIVVDAGGGEVTVANASKVRCECDIETTGDLIARADGARVSLTALHDAYNVHNHPPATAGASWGSGPPLPKAGG